MAFFLLLFAYVVYIQLYQFLNKHDCQLSLERVAKAVEEGLIGKKEDNAVDSLTPNWSI